MALEAGRNSRVISPCGDRRVIGVGEVAIEDPRDRVAGQVLERGVDDQAVARVAPLRQRRELPRSFARGDHDPTGQPSGIRIHDREAALEQRVVEGAIESNDQRIARARGGSADLPLSGLDAPADVARHSVALHRRACERSALCVGEAVVDDHFDGDALAERISGFAVRREAALDARGIEQDGRAHPLPVPELGFHR